jgi:hypothetical protein
MNGNERRPGTPFEPPWSVDLLADLHAGVLDPRTEAELRPRVDADPEARAVLAALDATLADLSSLPPLTMPASVAARIDAALAAEARSATPAPVLDLNAARQRKAKRLGWGAGLLAAAAVAVGVVVIALPSSNNNDSTPGQAQPNPAASGTVAPDLLVQGQNFGPVFGDVLKAQNYGPLEDQETLAGCLKGGNIASSKPLGVSPIKLDDKSAVMAILPGGTRGTYRIVVLDPKTCGPDNPNGVLANTLIAP